jgi:hypothetical protein
MKRDLLRHYTGLAGRGTRAAVDEIMGHLNMDMSIAESKIIDFALGLVEGEEGFRAMEHYLFHGTQVQRNYCALYFARRGEYLILREAYDMGLVDALQAFSR